MNKEIFDKPSDIGDEDFNSSEPDDNTENPISRSSVKPVLTYGDIVIMIWRRIKLNEKMTERLK